MAASDGVSRISPAPASVTSRVRWPLPCSTPPSGCDRSRSLAIAPWKSPPSRSLTSTLLPRTIGGVDQLMRASRSVRRTSSRSESRRCLRTSLRSTSRRIWEPPCRSRPSTSRRCAHAGQPLTTCSEKKLGTVKPHTKTAVTRMATIFHRAKYNIGSNHSAAGGPQPAALSSFTGSPLTRTSATMLLTCRTLTPSAISISI